MLKVSLKDELASSKKSASNEVDENSAIKEIKLLMEGDAAEDMRIARGLGRNHSLIVAQDTLGNKLEFEKLDGEYAGDVFTKEQIKYLAIKYNLRFLNTQYFCGNMDIQVIAKIKEFASKTNTNISDATLDRRFFILAPEQQFSLEKEVRLRKKDLDPIMFYQIDEQHYRLIHKWGVDFSIFRLISGMKWGSYRGFLKIAFLENLPFVTTIVTLLSSSTFKYEYTAAYWTFISVVSFIIALIRSSKFTDEGIIDSDFFSPKKWNSHKLLTRK